MQMENAGAAAIRDRVAAALFLGNGTWIGCDDYHCMFA
jgi:hypothetical protein